MYTSYEAVTVLFASSILQKQPHSGLYGFFFFANFFFLLLIATLLSSRQEDRYHSFDCACSNKEETDRARPPLISLAQTLVVNGKC